MPITRVLSSEFSALSLSSFSGFALPVACTPICTSSCPTVASHSLSCTMPRPQMYMSMFNFRNTVLSTVAPTAVTSTLSSAAARTSS
ncbi:hypothetical protein BDQ17DRAFT_1347824 [Cyathus striatus]|nr:hypothetical protein BDQ17DRAFT_1385281 [Cyathus striatus]KAF9010250.1 hypothetical protein BDQ17DRAFT_1347824 [Cyathus striatus]